MCKIVDINNWSTVCLMFCPCIILTKRSWKIISFLCCWDKISIVKSMVTVIMNLLPVYCSHQYHIWKMRQLVVKDKPRDWSQSEPAKSFEWKIFALCQIAFRADMKSYPVQYERQRYWTEKSRSHTSDIIPERLVERVWWTKSQSSLLNFSFRFGGFQSSLLVIYFRYGQNTTSHSAMKSDGSESDMWRITYKIGAAQRRSVTEISP